MKSLAAIFISIFILGITGCTSNSSHETRETKDSSDCAKTTIPKKMLQSDWKDSIVQKYIESSGDPLVAAIRNDTVHGLTYMYESEQRGGRSYITVRIGQSKEYRFVTSAWLYIDSMTKKVYDLDIPSDSLMELKK
ncbi:MAG TPA: hypothetical protein VE978_18675 [Chitinophagales bacterium]|nr:hypothetical protein [Chitinophagales bacterium]